MYLLVAPIGRGKSRVMSLLVRHLACNYLSCSNHIKSPAPILFSLGLFGLAESNDNQKRHHQDRLQEAVKKGVKSVAKYIVSMWANISQAVSGDSDLYTSDELFKALTRRRTVLVVDSVDEFCTQYDLGIDIVVSAFEWIRSIGAEHDLHHVLVMAIRSSARGLAKALENHEFIRLGIDELPEDEWEKLTNLSKNDRRGPIEVCCI